MDKQPLHESQCLPFSEVKPLTEADASALHQHLHTDWHIDDHTLGRTFRFSNYHETMAFANAVAYIAHAQDHHPDMVVRYRECRIDYTTHAVNALTRNDFICAARIDRLSLENH
ncbi:MAG TPA: 4a-hydroxytetrahydrobiopterin dehydratase [Gammaproteobacteria bacterium]|jgi:4a-hydroxytetrahydrobiopterin dehydratase|nr:4a-hydroxytetrahydrobiopterin dehydratase [Gammaproteobacteria bacterium]